MKGIRFYKEPCGTVVAALVENGPFFSGNTACYEAIIGLFNRKNSEVCGGSAALNYLADCKRISETEARQIHPQLFERLDHAEND